MQIIQLYIEGQRVDMFKDESVSITQSIKNVKDVSKVFTDFTRTFSLPASKTNNKIFKHYYNFDIIDGFDARVRVSSNIELNNLPFRDGYIKLEGVDLKDNKAHTYKITFFGNTVSLKNIISEDKLSDLSWLNNFSKDYSVDEIKNYLTTQNNQTVDGVNYIEPIQIPLVTHSQRLYYNSNTSGTHNNDGNVYWEQGTGHSHGVKYDELKYALKLPLIIKAIEEKYPEIQFSNDFFKDETNKHFSDLYMWLHRVKGKVTNGLQLQEFEIPIDFVADRFITGEDEIEVICQDGVVTFKDPNVYSESRYVAVIAEPTDLNTPYRIRLDKTDGSGNYVTILQTDNVQGNYSFYYEIPNSELEENSNGVSFKAYVSIGETMTFTKLGYEVYWEFYDPNCADPLGTDCYEEEFVYIDVSNYSVQGVIPFVITEQIPEMKILDFLSGLFKMFNLVAYFDNDIIVVKSLDEFYQEGVDYNITKYIDTSKSQVNVALPYREIIYAYKGLGTILAKQHNQIRNTEWSSEVYRQDNSKVFSGDVFNYTVPFDHFKFERILDQNNGEQTDVQWGFCVTDTQESYFANPFLFYINRKSASISYINSVDASGEPQNHEEILNFFIPTNSNQNITTFADQPNINFKPELDEWEGLQNLNTLFQEYHSNYITSVFNQNNRISKVTAYLPLRILLNYSLADRFIINGNSYKINSITTNLENGKSELELLNDL